MPRPDDDALFWEGDDDPTLDTGVDADAPAAGPSAPAEAVTDSATANPATDSEPAPGAAAPGEPPVVPVSPQVDPAPGSAPAGPASGMPRSEDVADDEEEKETRRLGDAALVSLGVLGGVYLLWTIGWVLGALRLREWIQIRTGAVADAMFHGSMVLGILAPAIWFGAAWYLTRRRPGWVRIAAIVLGVIVLVPWPFVMVGVIGQ